MTQIKICGITNEEDALCAVKLGAAALGFIFYPPSPRYVRPKVVRKIVKKLPPNLAKVGVFVNESAEEIKRSLNTAGLILFNYMAMNRPSIAPNFRQHRSLKLSN